MQNLQSQQLKGFTRRNLPSIPMKSPIHSVSTRDVPVAEGPAVSSENESGISQGR